jgi:type II secretory pathway pseudopilin PulG
MKMNKKALTLVEILVAIFIVTIAVGGMFLVYPTLFEGVKVTSNKVRAWEIARQKIETLRNTTFSTLWNISFDPENPPFPQPEIMFTETNCVFPSGCSIPSDFEGSAVYYINQVHGNTTAVPNPADEILTDLLQLEVTVCFRAGQRTVGEDTNLNGLLDSGEDLDGDRKLSSPLTLKTLLINQ